LIAQNALHHENLVPILSIGRESIQSLEYLVIVSPLAECSLAILDRVTVVVEAICCEQVITAVTSALCRLHSLGIAHHGITPSKVLFFLDKDVSSLN
jgi:hypothetical protein